MIKLRRLTKKEDQKFKRLCEEDDLLNSNLGIENFPGEDISINVEIDEDKKFNNKLDLGEYLYKKLRGIQMDTKIWHFLVIVYHKQLLNNSKKIGEIDRFYIDPQKSFYPFTHLLKSVFDLYGFYHDNAESIKFLLLNLVNESGGLFLETVKRQDMMKNINFIQVSKKIFYDEKKNEIKKGAAEHILRLIDLFKQYERTYDLYSMPADKIIKNLMSKHREFDKFKTGLLIKHW